ncbi:unknown [Eggerthella sp. CAG:298]|nr:unknown [Eggerthella sp. CAG:298]
MLHDRAYPTLRITHDATIARRILHLHAQHHDRRLRSLLRFYQCGDRFRSNERRITREHHERTGHLSEHLARGLHCVRSSKLFFLNDDLRIFDQRLDKFATMTDDSDHRFDASTMGCIDHPANEGFFKYLMCHFWLG